MVSVALESSLVLAIGLLMIFGALYSAETPVATGCSVNPLVPVGLALEAAYMRPLSIQVAQIDGKSVVNFSENAVSFEGCTAPFPAIPDPSGMFRAQSANRLTLNSSLVFASAGVYYSCPCEIYFEYLTWNSTMRVSG